MKELILKTIEEVGYPIISKENFVNIYGFRRQRGEFNDFIVTITFVDGEMQLNTFQATTEPGQGWLWDVMGNKNGTFSLKEGYYNKCWVLGKHKGRYTALVQNYKDAKFVGYRDSNKNGVIDYSGRLFDDVTGLNLHTTKLGYLHNWIGKYSAGCQVILDYSRFMKELIPLLKVHSEKYTYFNYGLIKISF